MSSLLPDCSIDIVAVIRYNNVEVNEMDINELLRQKNMTRYRLAKESGVPHSTLKDVCLGKARIENCSVGNVYKIAQTLGVSMESLVADAMEYRPGFETFKSNVCHLVKDMGDLEFIIETLESGEIRRLFDKKWYAECLYLLAMVDYLSRENGLPLCADYADIRGAKLCEIIYPAGVIALCSVSGNNEWKNRSRAEAIPEFMRHNIVEAEVRNIV
jgi:transcriptional regulator with XRE-family HTH domain